jgi:kinesin family protein 5
MFLERNLEQLTVVQRQLVEQNSSLKKEVAIAERKLIARNERIQSLESLLQDSQEKLTAANHRYVETAFHNDCLPPFDPFAEQENIFPRRRAPIVIKTPYQSSTSRAPSSPTQQTQPLSPCFNSTSPEASYIHINPPHRFEAQLTAVKERLEAAKAGSTRGLGPRIAKPLRGGGGPAQDSPALPVLGQLQAQEKGEGGKRTSWFFNQR